MGDYDGGLAAMAWAQVWQVTVVALAVGAIAPLVGRRRPHLAYVLWLLVVVKCLMPPLWSSPLGVFSWAGGSISGKAATSLPPAGSTLPPRETVASNVAADVDRERSRDAAEWPNPLAGAADSAASEPGIAAPPETEPSTPTPLPWSDRFSASVLLAVAWLFGAVAYLAVVVIRMLRWESVVRRARPPGDGPLVDLVGRLSARLGVRRKVSVRITAEALGPAVVGTVRPAVLLPEVLVASCSSEQLEPIVAHELIHIRRGDAAVGALQVLAQCLWWFHPLVWWVNRAVCRERERCCDAEAVGSLGCPPEKYAQGLLDVLRLQRHLAPAAGMPGMYPYQITRMRLETVMNPAIRVHRRTPRGYWLVFAAGLLFSLPGVEATGEAEPPAASPTVVAKSAAANATAADSLAVAPPSVEPVKTLSGHAGAVCSVAFSPNGKILASAGVDDVVRLWELPEGKLNASLKIEPRPPAALRVYSVAFSPDGKLLAAGGTDGLLRLWDPVAAKPVRTFPSHKNEIRCVAFSVDGKWVAGAGADALVKLWDVDSGKPVHDGFRGANQSIAFTPDGKSIVTADTGGAVKFFQLNPPELQAEVSNWTEVFSIACAPNDQGLAIGLGWGEAITLWTPDADGEMQRYVLGGHQYGTNAVAFSPDSTIIASAGKDGKIKIWDMSTRRMLGEATAARGAAMTVAFSPDGKQVASGGADHQIRLWSVDELKARPQETPRFPKVEEPPRPVVLRHAEEPRLVALLKRLGAVFLAKGARPSWSPDATRIVYVSADDSELQILDLVTGKVRSFAEIGRDPAWSPAPGRWIAYTSGRQIAQFMGSRSRSTPLIDPPQGDEEIRLIDLSGDPPRKIAEGYAPAWSADARTLYFISGKDQKVKSVEVKDDGSPGAIKDLFGITIESLVAAISPDGRRVAYLGDGRLVVADREGDKTMPTWPVRHLRDWLLGWSPDGKQLGGTGVWGFGGLVFLNQDTGRAVRLGTGELAAPAWSPDGSMIAFDAHLVDGSEIWMIDAKTLAAPSSTETPFHPIGQPAHFDLASPFQPEGTLSYVDLQPKADQTMDLPTFDTPFNDMLKAPRGERTLGGVKFTIGPGSLQLGSGLLPTAPERIEGIPVGKHVARMYVLHGTQFGGPTHGVADGTTIGWYRIVYEDASEESIAIVSGEDVGNWFADDAKEPTRGAKVWEGQNLLAQWLGSSVRLFASGWANPHREKKVARIDYLAAGTQAAPFCLAITIEEPASR